jgi:hypothetical protein
VADAMIKAMETTQHEVVQRPLCRKGWMVPGHNMGLTYCFALYSCYELDRRKLFSVKLVSQVLICCCPS